jgi:hypothetical protein
MRFAFQMGFKTEKHFFLPRVALDDPDFSEKPAVDFFIG